MKFWTGDVRLIRVVVRREAPANTRIATHRRIRRIVVVGIIVPS